MPMTFVICFVLTMGAGAGTSEPPEANAWKAGGVIPFPMSTQPAEGEWTVSGASAIVYDAPELARAGELLAGRSRPASA